MHFAQLRHAFVLAVLLGASAALGGHRAAVAAEGDFAGPVDIGGGRHMYLECRGTGGPTVILESGYHDSAQPWSLNDAFPPAVLIGVARVTKVCAYDRPGTLLYTDPPSHHRPK